MAAPEQFYLSKTEPNKSCFLGLRDIILNFNENISETTKYGMPCFCYGKKALCYLWTDKKNEQPYVLIVDGNLIDHPMLVTGDRARMKIFPVDPNQDIDKKSLEEILNLAVEIQLKK